jgi:opacity protein-like surface antigen
LFQEQATPNLSKGDFMRFKLNARIILTLLFALAVIPVHSQVGPAATKGGSLPMVFGMGGNDFAIDWGPGTRMQGLSAWIDLYPFQSRKASGLGFEVEGNDLNFNRPTVLSKMRQDTGLAGPIFAFSHSTRIRPYVKYLAGIGSIDFPPSGSYSHDTFLVGAPAGGAEIRVWEHMWFRANYEYQFWHDVFGPHDLNPNGVTFGVSYDFRSYQSEK